MSIPTDEEILALLDRLDQETADDLESQWLDFKPWTGSRRGDMKVAVEYAVCFANAEGGVIVYGVADQTRGRDQAIVGVGRCDQDVWLRGIYEATTPSINVEISELAVPEGTGKLLVVRVPKGNAGPYGTSQGLFKQRVGKNCMALDPTSFITQRVRTGAIDWSGQSAEGISLADLDPAELARARAMLRRANPESDLLRLGDQEFLVAMGAIREGQVTRTGLLLFGQPGILHQDCPQHQVHYVYQTSPTAVARNDSYRQGILAILERLEQAFSGPVNPEHELSVGLFKLRIPSYPMEVVREAVLNAVTHRDYTDPGEILIRHTTHQLTITSPGGFIGGITPRNILRREPVSRNRTLAEAFEKLRLVERAGVGRLRIFMPMLEYGKRPPEYETDGTRVTLQVHNGSFDERMARLVARWRKDGREVDLDCLLVLTHLRESPYLDIQAATELLQLPLEDARRALHRLSRSPHTIIETRGKTKGTTYHLHKGIAKDLVGKVAYSRIKGISHRRYAEMVRQYVTDHGSITPKECRELLGLGDSRSAMSEMTRYLSRWTAEGGFLRREGKPPKTRYFRRS